MYAPVGFTTNRKYEWIAEQLAELADAVLAFPVVVAGHWQLGAEEIETFLQTLGGAWMRLPCAGYTCRAGTNDTIDHVLLSTAAAPLVAPLSLQQAGITLSPHAPIGVSSSFDLAKTG